MTTHENILIGDHARAKESLLSDSPSTLVVIGPPRSGTSMVAGIIRLLGVYFGECTPRNNEDPNFNAKRPIESIRGKIAEYNGTHPKLWGWKAPTTHKYYAEVADLVRSPVFVVVYRNILSSIKSKVKHTGEGEFDKLSRAYANHYVGISRLTSSDYGPTLHLSYEEAVKNPVALASELSELIYGKPMDKNMEQMVADYCTPGSYKTFKEFKENYEADSK